MELMEISICTTCLMKSDVIMLLQLQLMDTISIEKENHDILRFKSDNYLAQYKLKRF